MHRCKFGKHLLQIYLNATCTDDVTIMSGTYICYSHAIWLTGLEDAINMLGNGSTGHLLAVCSTQHLIPAAMPDPLISDLISDLSTIWRALQTPFDITGLLIITRWPHFTPASSWGNNIRALAKWALANHSLGLIVQSVTTIHVALGTSRVARYRPQSMAKRFTSRYKSWELCTSAKMQ